jgi:hypothetical protein
MAHGTECAIEDAEIIESLDLAALYPAVLTSVAEIDKHADDQPYH